jgi:hypothetical protein
MKAKFNILYNSLIDEIFERMSQDKLVITLHLEDGSHNFHFQYSPFKNDPLSIKTARDLKQKVAYSLGYDESQIILKDKYKSILIDNMDIFDLLFTYQKFTIKGLNPELIVTIPFDLTKKDYMSIGPAIKDQ